MAVQTVAPARDGSPPQVWRGRARLALAGAVLVGLGAVGASALHGRTAQSDLFEDHGDGFIADPLPVSRAQLSLGMTFPDSHATPGGSQVLTLHSVRSHLSTNTARASVTYWICQGSTPVGFVSGSVTDYCRSMVPIVDGTKFRYPSSDHYLLATLTPTVPGRATLRRSDISYSVGGREVTDSIRVQATLQATADHRVGAK